MKAQHDTLRHRNYSGPFRLNGTVLESRGRWKFEESNREPQLRSSQEKVASHSELVQTVLIANPIPDQSS